MTIECRGRFVDRHTIEFDLRYDHPRRRVWQALTEPASLSAWLMPMEIELRVGGAVVLRPDSPSRRAHGVVTALEPESLLECSFDPSSDAWPESVLRFDLADEDGGAATRLRFTQRLAPGATWSPPHDAGQIAGPGTFHPGTCAGWEGFFVEGLTRFLDGRGAPVYDDTDDQLMAARTPVYRRRIASEFGDVSVAANLAELVDEHTMRHTRWYPHPVERVWKAITDGAEASVWHGWPVTIEARLGGHCIFGPASDPFWESDVVVFEPPNVIEFSHPNESGGAIRYELAEERGGCRMVFTQWFHPSDERPWRPDFVGGFHGMFDLLGWVLDGEPVDRDPWRWRDVLVPAYEVHLREA